MRFGINTLDDVEVRNKVVLCRLDINQPVDRERGRLRDITRLQACVPTVQELSQRGAKLVLLAHQGSDIEYENYYSTEPHAGVLTQLLGREVAFIDDVCGPEARQRIRQLGSGEILLLDNVRFLAEEQTLFEHRLALSHAEQAKTLLVRKLAPLADLYVCDAFAAAHRSQPSLCGFGQVLPSAMGRLFEKELGVLTQIMAGTQRPAVFVLGGAKISDAFVMLESLLQRGSVDRVLTGGLVALVMLWAGGQDIGEASRRLITKRGYKDLLPKARSLLEDYPKIISLPRDLAWTIDDQRHEGNLTSLGRINKAITDIGSETAGEYVGEIMRAKTIFANGPMGVFEKPASEYGTQALWEAMGAAGAYTVIGGGDSIAAARQYGQTEKIDYICTGGGALVRFLSGEELPVIRALKRGSELTN